MGASDNLARGSSTFMMEMQVRKKLFLFVFELFKKKLKKKKLRKQQILLNKEQVPL